MASDLSYMETHCVEPAVDERTSSMQMDLFSFFLTPPKESEMLKIQQVFYSMFWSLLNHPSSWILTIHKAPPDLPSEVSAFGFSQIAFFYIAIFQKKHLFLVCVIQGEKRKKSGLKREKKLYSANSRSSRCVKIAQIYV